MTVAGAGRGAGGVVGAGRSGVVVEFDEHVGLGTVRESGPAGAEYLFHCTAILDGSRTIPVGAAVDFAVVAARLGRLEATALRAVSGAGGPAGD